jgi:hypothetical protein
MNTDKYRWGRDSAGAADGFGPAERGAPNSRFLSTSLRVGRPPRFPNNTV